MAKEYLQYKDEFQRQCILKFCACIVGVLAVCGMLFLPMFEWKNELLAVLIGKDKMRFSLFDEVRLIVELVKGEDASHFLLGLMVEPELGSEFYNLSPNPMTTFLFFGVIEAVVAVVLLVIEGVKAGNNFMDLEGYTLEQYDKMKWRQEEKKKWGWGNISFMSMLLCAVVFFGIYLVFSVVVIGRIEETDNTISYFLFDEFFLNGWFYLVLICLIAMFVLHIMSNNIRKKIQRQIIKGEYAEQPPIFNEE